MNKRKTAARRGGGGLAWTLVPIGLGLAVVVFLAVVRPSRPQAKPVPVAAAVMADLTRIPTATWNRVGATGATPPVLVQPIAGSTGRPPLVLYVGAEYCPFCAAQRWPLVATLARFGSLTGLQYTTSSATDVYPSTPTFTFVDASYKSSAIQLQTVELQGNAEVNGQYPSLQTPTANQQSLVNHYDEPPYVPQASAGSIPFLLINGRYLFVGASYSPGLLSGQSWSGIASALPTGQGGAASAILANANEMTAAICAVDGNLPAAVCQSSGVQAAARTLPTKAAGSSVGGAAATPGGATAAPAK